MLVSHDFSRLTACEARSLASEFPGRSAWLTQFAMRRMFHAHVSEERSALAFVLIRRAEAALDEWELACETASRAPGAPSVYFKALRHFEASITALYQGLEFGRNALGTKFFEKGDGSVIQRINSLYNKSRHFDPSDLPSGRLHAVWFGNDCLRTNEIAVTFTELRDVLAEVCRVANTLATASELRLDTTKT